MSFLKKYVENRLQDPEFRKHWEESKLEHEVARQIIQLRKEKGITQEQLAELLHTKQSAISRIENGDQNITLGMMRNIANVFGGKVKIEFENPFDNVFSEDVPKVDFRNPVKN